MAKINYSLQDVVDYLTVTDTEFLNDFSTGQKVFDFIPGDLVKCTLLKGYHRVCGINGDKIVISTITKNGNLENIDPNFLQKVDLDRRWVKVLYENRNRRLHSR